MEYTKKEREAYNNDRKIKCNKLGISINDYNYLRLQGQRLKKIYEQACNGVIDYGEEYDKAVKMPEYKIKKRCESLGLNYYLQTDPRGATVYVDRKPIADNDYTQAHCIY